MKRLISIAALLLTAHAHAAIDCLPKNWSGTGSTSYLSTSSPTTDDAVGSWVGWACPAPAINGVPQYKPNLFVAVKGLTLTNPSTMLGLVPSGLTVDGVNAMLAVGSVPPATEQQAIDYNHLVVAAKVHIANNLAAQLVPPAGPEVWHTPKATTGATFTMYNAANGKLSGLISGKKAPPDALCSCTTTKVMSGTSTYCALDGAPGAEVTLCKKVAP